MPGVDRSVVIAPVCPRCGGPLEPPGLMSSGWRCALHQDVEPLTVLTALTEQSLGRAAATAAVPVWVPWPPPYAWTLGGVGWAGDERSGGRATVTAWCGPSPVGGPAELLVVAEEPGVGLAAWLAGVGGLDAGEVTAGPPDARAEVHGHPTGLWRCPDVPADRVAYVGEAAGCWLWLVLWPPEAELLLLERLLLVDSRAHPVAPQLGAASPQLAALAGPTGG